MTRIRSFTRLALALVIAAQPLLVPTLAVAADDLKIALVAPLSGRWARQGQLIQMGAEMAVDEINQKGGIKALKGAKMRLIVADAGDSAEKAKNAGK